MNRKIKHYFASLFLALVMTLAMYSQAFAARIAFSDPSGNVGEEISVSMKVTSTGTETISNVDVMLSYDASALEFLSGTGATGGAGSIHVSGAAENQGNKELAFTLKFRAAKAGTSSINISTQEVYDQDSQVVNVEQQGSSKVTVQGTSAASSNASLAVLEISPGNLSPSFSADVVSYTATVGGDVERISVSAPAQDANASVSVSGNEGLQTGENQVVCTVTAQDGQTVKTYTINVTKVEGTDGTGAGTSQDGVRLKTPERLITVFSIPADVEVPEGFVSCTIGIDGHDVQGWVLESEEEPSYCVFYGINENGEQEFYRYDRAERTLQRYFQDLTPGGITQAEYEAMVTEYNSLVHDYDVRFWIIIGLIVFSVLLLIVIIILVATRGQRDDFIERRDSREDYPEKVARERASREQKRTREPRESREPRQSRETREVKVREPKRTVSQAERYQRDLEPEEEMREQVEAQYFRRENQIREQMNRERMVRQNGTQPISRPPVQPANPAQRQGGVPQPKEDEGLEFIDL